MRVHLITNLFAPDELAGAALFTDLAEFLRDQGHDIRVTTTFSYYPAWKLRPEDVGQVVRDEFRDGVPVRRVKLFVPAIPTGKSRLFSDLSFLWSLIRRGRHSQWQPDVVLTALPMLSQCLAQRFLYLGRRIPRLIVVQDFVVEAALELRILNVPGFSGVLRTIQRWALRSAQTLVTISPLMLKKLRESVGEDRRVVYLPNWIHGSLQRQIQRRQKSPTNRLERQLFYAGNLGVKQGLPDFLESFASSGVAHRGWSLAIHGGGAERARLVDQAAKTPGCKLGEVLEEDAYLEALLSCTACLVTQRPGVGANFLPSKLLPALATGTPVLAVCERNSPLAHEVLEGGFGAVVTPGEGKALSDVLAKWQQNPAELVTLGARALVRAERYSRELILSEYVKELEQLVVDRQPSSN